MSFSNESYKTKLNKRTDNRANSIFSGRTFTTAPIPMRKGADGKLYKWEPEFGPLLKDRSGLLAAKTKIANIDNFKIFPNFHRDFSYVTATIKTPKGYVGRARFNYYNRPCEHLAIRQSFRLASDTTIGIKSAAKSPLRSEYEADLDEQLNLHHGLKDLTTQHNGSLPSAIRRLQPKDIYTEGLMAVERAGYEGTHLLCDGIHKHLISYAGSFDIGACLDIRSISTPTPNVIGKRIEAEIEAIATRSTAKLNKKERVEIIETSMAVMEPIVDEVFEGKRLVDDPRCGLSKNGHAAYDMAKRSTCAELRSLGLQPEDLLKSKSQEGLHIIFEGAKRLLMPPKSIHSLSEISENEAEVMIADGIFPAQDEIA